MRLRFAAITIAFALLPAATANGHTFKVGQSKARAAAIEGCAEQFTVKDYRRYARPVYRRERVSKRAHARLRRMHICQRSGWQGRQLVGGVHKRQYRARKARQRAARIAASLTPYAGPGGTRWAIPWYIVSCESGGSWTAANPSGAIGPYQFLGKRIVWPVRTQADRNAHHRLAAQLWRGGAGASHWQQCL